MQTLLHLMNSGQVKYNDPYFRLFASVASAQFIVTLLEEVSWIELLNEQPYYLAIGVGVMVALLMIYLVYRVSIWLDVYSPWPKNVLKRLALQCLLGIVAPTLIGVLAIYFYYRWMGTSMSETRYVGVLLKIKILLLVLANIYYFGLFLHTALKMRKKQKNEELSYKELTASKALVGGLEATVEENEVIVKATHVTVGGEHDLVPAALAAASEVLSVSPTECKKVQLQLPPGWHISQLWLVLSENRVAQVYHQDQLSMPWTLAIKDTMPLLPDAGFFKINKSCIVHRENILRAFYSADKRNIKLILASPQQKVVTVGRFQKNSFEKWYDLSIIQKTSAKSIL